MQNMTIILFLMVLLSDRLFLLRFLRASKFSQLVARKRLEKWLSVLDTMSDWLRDIDLEDPAFMDFYDTG